MGGHGGTQPLINFYPQSCGPRKHLRPASDEYTSKGDGGGVVT